MGGGKSVWFQPFAHVWNFPRNLGNRVILVFFRVWNTHNCVILIFFHVMATCSDRVLISLGLMHNLHRWRIQCLEAMDKWPCGDCFTFYSMMLRDDILIENNKYGYVTMQNNGTMKIVNFTHAHTAETRRSFLHPWMPGTRLGSMQPYIPCVWALKSKWVGKIVKNGDYRILYNKTGSTNY